REAVYVAGGNRYAREQRHVGLVVIPFRIPGFEPSLVPPPHVHSLPFEGVYFGVFGDGAEHRDTDTPSREADVHGRATLEDCPHDGHETARHGLDELVLRFVDDYSLVGHAHSFLVGVARALSPSCRTEPKSLSGLNRRSSSARQSRSPRRGSEMSCTG